MTGTAPAPAVWDREQAELYDSAYDAPGRRGALVRARAAAALELLGDGPGAVLDAGMGGGRLCQELGRRRFSVSGADVSAAMVALACRRLPELRDRLVEAPIEALPYAPESFDAVTALGVLEFASDPLQALRELARVLRPGGTAVVSWPAFDSIPIRWRSRVLYPAMRQAKRRLPFGRPTPPPARHPLPRSRFLALLASAGLAPAETISLSPGGARLGPVLAPLLAAQLVVSARRRP